jgi:hypothetical protein
MINDVIYFFLPSGFATQFICYSLCNSELIDFHASVSSA